MRSKNELVYLIRLTFLGTRYHGWSIQPEVKTVQGVLEKNISYALGSRSFKLLGSSRTDAGVSALQYFVQLTTKYYLPADMREKLNYHLPADIQIHEVVLKDRSFHLLDSIKSKRYVYLFQHNKKLHPFYAAFITSFSEELDIDLMKRAAHKFVGKHDFFNYEKKGGKNNDTVREIFICKIEEYKDQFDDVGIHIPPETFCMIIEADGFLRHMVRLIMGQLVEIGTGTTSIDELELSLKKVVLTRIRKAPPNGLILQRIQLH